MNIKFHQYIIRHSVTTYNISKMADDKLTLSSPIFETKVPNSFRNLWNDLDFADVTLATIDNQQIRAHKVILSSCSPFFHNLLLRNPHQNPLIYHLAY